MTCREKEKACPTKGDSLNILKVHGEHHSVLMLNDII